jgi:hypothetical protein
MRAEEFTVSKKNVHPSGKRPDYIVGPEVEHTAAYGKKTLILNTIENLDLIDAVYDEMKCEHIYLELTYALRTSKTPTKTIADYKNLARRFLKRDITVTIDVPNDIAGEFADLVKQYKNCVLNVAIQLPDMHKLGDRVSMKFVGGEDGNKSGGVYVMDLDAIRKQKNFTPWSAYDVDVKIEPGK